MSELRKGRVFLGDPDSDDLTDLRLKCASLERELAEARAVLDSSEPATWMESADGTMLVRVPAAAWQAWRDFHEQQAAKYGYVDAPESDPVHDTWEEHRGER